MTSTTDTTNQSPAAEVDTFEPREKIADFDWDGLYSKFQEDMDKHRRAEQVIFEEMGRLTAYFQVWAETMHEYETQRAGKRLKTRITKVVQSEGELEQKRLHYVKVVDAFQSALNLLNA